jgi:hypothetical protein
MNFVRLPYNYLVLFLINSSIDVFPFPLSQSAAVDFLLPPNTTFCNSSNSGLYSQQSLKLLM